MNKLFHDLAQPLPIVKEEQIYAVTAMLIGIVASTRTGLQPGTPINAGRS